MSLVLPSLAWRIHRRPPHVESAGQTVRVPELPEVESARAAIEAAGSGPQDRRCGRSATAGCAGRTIRARSGRRWSDGSLTAANRRGKSMACETSGVGRSRSPGPELGIHLGMSGRILIMAADGASTEGGDWLGGRYAASRRCAEPKADLGPLHDHLRRRRHAPLVRQAPARAGAAGSGPRTTRTRRGDDHRPRSSRTASAAARLRSRPDCWTRASSPGSATCSPTRRCGRPGSRRAGRRKSLSADELTMLRRALRKATKAAIKNGGVHTGTIIEYRKTGRHCPRCGAEMTRAIVGGPHHLVVPAGATRSDRLRSSSELRGRTPAPGAPPRPSSTARRVRASTASCSNHASTAAPSTSAPTYSPRLVRTPPAPPGPSGTARRRTARRSGPARRGAGAARDSPGSRAGSSRKGTRSRSPPNPALPAAVPDAASLAARRSRTSLSHRRTYVRLTPDQADRHLLTPGHTVARVSDDVICGSSRRALPAAVVLRTNEVIAFLDHRPVFKGHVLVAPIVHVDTLLDLPPDSCTPVVTAAQQAAAAIVAGLGCAGHVRRGQQCGQPVDPPPPRPRRAQDKGDGLRGFFWPRTKYADGEMTGYAQLIRENLSQNPVP